MEILLLIISILAIMSGLITLLSGDETAMGILLLVIGTTIGLMLVIVPFPDQKKNKYRSIELPEDLSCISKRDTLTIEESDSYIKIDLYKHKPSQKDLKLLIIK